MLLAEGADPTLLNREGFSAQECAEQGGHDEIAELLTGAVEEWTRPFLLQVSVCGTGPEVKLLLRTLSGNVAAKLPWSSSQPVQELPAAVLAALRASEFQSPFRLRVSNLRLILPHGRVMELDEGAPPFFEQFACGAEST